MARRKLNSSSDFGQITPPFMGAVFTQDGVYFDGRGLEIFTDAHQSTEARQKSIDDWQAKEDQAANMRAAKSAASQTDQTKTSDQGNSAEPGKTAEPAADAPEGEHEPPASTDAPDLRKWAMGEQSIPWFTVRKMMSEKYSFDAMNKLAAEQKLIEMGVVTADEVQSAD